ncbi:MAG: C40 family peptidase [Bacteroidaceae bacterium]|nr:C40 family peptidase [Bacteroidaceae bacterium]
MNIKRIIIALLAAVVVPFGSTVDAAKARKKNAHKTSVHKSSAKKTTTTKTVAAAEVMTSNEAIANADDVSGETIVKTAMQYIGVPYRHGTSSPKSFDCSGFTSYVFKQYDINLSRSSRTQYTQGQVIKNKSDLRAGDLVFFQGRSGKGGVGHVGIVAEVHKDKSFTFVHASTSKGITTEQSTTAYYSQRYVGARRILTGEE